MLKSMVRSDSIRWRMEPHSHPSLPLSLPRPCFHRWALLTGELGLAEQNRCCIWKAGRRRRQARLVLNSEPPIPPPRCLYGRCDGAASASFIWTPEENLETHIHHKWKTLNLNQPLGTSKAPTHPSEGKKNCRPLQQLHRTIKRHPPESSRYSPLHSNLLIFNVTEHLILPCCPALRLLIASKI